ncbi:MAG: T9SS type A sorting domain-containing protein, partial [Bacteroidales bacterium]|nr:T9SS type A sorting domain-containing protein [Bacteroidales bacterium]
GKVQVVVFNHLGQEVIRIVDEMQTAGSHQVRLNNYELNGAGSYFYQINVESDRQRFTERGTIVLTK